MSRLYRWFGGRKVFNGYLFAGIVLVLTASYALAGTPPAFEWVVGPLSLALLGTQATIAAEDRAKAKAAAAVAVAEAAGDVDA